MTEQEWLTCTDPTPMMELLEKKSSDRKFRLFAVACCRTVRHLLPDERCWNAVLVAERFADGQATDHDLAVADGVAVQFQEEAVSWVERLAAQTVGEATKCNSRFPARRVWERAALALEGEAVEQMAHREATGHVDEMMEAWLDAWLGSERAVGWTDSDPDGHLVSLLRCSFGNPFRSVIADPKWLTSTVIALAQGIYDDRAFHRLPILADALQDAGCDNTDVLDHCRSADPHVRGCWVIDLLLGKS
ncbi:hypothetical protein R5W24_001812 [Gemmata sp. JC717]|uniref:hypothetical protein n=1 Tax=Gemmata algarum TaxID=2975278 RepID=UPI0021BAF2B1|nr:hypothetical protein [Gemmata algarum]MDY3552724.1 hypothetical protein [Gemmata algarum]